MRFLSVCSGIEAASVAWQPLGWKAWAFSEIEPFPCSVLAHHYPDTPNHGDMTKFKDWPDGSTDLLCGGTPCQSFSAAGLRAGLDDPRGQLMLTFGAIAARYRPRWLVWENVPGVLSSNGGRDFGAFLGLLGHLGYGFAYRVLDAQFVRVDGYARAVPQRRQRVFVVGCLGDWRSAAAVLLERESLRGDSAPRRSSGARVAATLTAGAANGGAAHGARSGSAKDATLVAGTLACNTEPNGHGFGDFLNNQAVDANPVVAHALAYGGNNTRGPIEVATACRAKGGSGHGDFESETFVAHTLRGDGFDASEDGTGRGTPLVPVLPFDTTQLTSAANRSSPKPGDPCHPLAAEAHAPAIAFDARQSDVIQYGDKTGPLDTDGHTMGVQTATAVRRLMPVECERLQGFPDGYTAVMHRGKPAADGPRYKALGNSWAIPPVRWIGMRIAMVDGLRATMKVAA
jgi:DNA (cytosine-5)-methyltransferase 1